MAEPELPEHSADDLLKSELPRFGIVDLMMITAGIAIVFALRNQMESIGWSARTDQLWFKILEGASFCFLYGLPLAALYRFVVQKRLTGRFFAEPGHWILAATAVLSLGFGLVPVFLISIFGDVQPTLTSSANAWFFFVPYACVCLIASVLLLFGVNRVPRWWKSILFLIALMDLALAAQQLVILLMFVSNTSWTNSSMFLSVEWVAFGLQTVASVGLVLLVVKEFRKGPKRDLWHWIGVAVLFVGCVIYPCLMWIYRNYLFDPTAI